MNLYIVIAVFNRKEYTLSCLRQLEIQTFSNYKIVLVDDGSTDGTDKEVRKRFPKVKIIKGAGNWWWTKSMNEGIKYALKDKADFILFMNNDNDFDKNYLQILVELATQHSGSIIGSLDVAKTDPPQIFFSGIKKMIWWKAKSIKYHKGYEPYVDDMTGLHESIVLNGRGTIVPRKVFTKMGLLDEKNLPQYASDFDFILRAKKHGFKTLVSWDAVLYSYIETTGEGKPYIKQNLSKFLRSFFKKYSQTSLSTNFNYYRKHCKWYYLPLAFPIDKMRMIYSYYKRQNAFMEN